jgi:hypothetical protein
MKNKVDERPTITGGVGAQIGGGSIAEPIKVID